METLLGLMLASAPFALVAALLALAERRERRAGLVVSRQIALTDALHARLGAAVAPVVRLRRGRWQLHVAVPVGRPAVVSAVLGTADEMFGRGAYELRLRRQEPTPPLGSARRAAPTARESLSWR
jgi:hypothetical protein